VAGRGLHPQAQAPLDERARRVLAAIVRDYIQGGEPVGSHAIARRAEVDVSSATVRAVMADLEELGYLEKPHTSAGRIPTSRGYRYYVDALLRVKPPLDAAAHHAVRARARRELSQFARRRPDAAGSAGEAAQRAGTRSARAVGIADACARARCAGGAGRAAGDAHRRAGVVSRGQGV